MTDVTAPPHYPSLVGRGVYDVLEVARIIGRSPATVMCWTGGQDALHPIDHDRIISFVDLISLWVISELVRRGVPRGEVASGGRFLASKLNTGYPYAHRDLATVGAGFFRRDIDDMESWVDVGGGEKGSFQTVIENLLRPIEYGADLHATV